MEISDASIAKSPSQTPQQIQIATQTTVQTVTIQDLLRYLTMMPTVGEPLLTRLETLSMMDIPGSPITNLPLPANTPLVNGLPLQINQRISAQVFETQTLLDTLTLKIGENTLQVSVPAGTQFNTGQNLNLSVVKLLPQAVFQIVDNPPAELPSTSKQASNPAGLRLTQIPVPTTPTPASLPATINSGQTLTAQVASVTPKQITLQWMPAQPIGSNAPSAQQPLQISLNAEQWTLNSGTASGRNPSSATPALSVGQTVYIQLQPNSNDSAPKIVITPAQTEAVTTQALRELLPIQASPSLLIQQLNHLPDSEQIPPTVAETLKQLARNVLQQLPTPSQLSQPMQLKHSVEQSGLFLESKLLALLTGQTDIDLPDDFKLKLNKLAQWLQQTLVNNEDKDTELPPAMKQWLQQTAQHNQSALAKITLDQLNSLPKEDSTKQAWILELPVMLQDHVDTVHIAIERDQSYENPEAQQNWAVSITITPPDLATIQCRIACYDNTINTRFWSESADTVATINQHLDVLKQQFAAQGLTSGFMEAHQDQRSQAPLVQPAAQGLIREKV